MEPRVLDLLDLTVSQAVLMLHQALEESPGEALDVAIPPEEMLRDNLVRLLSTRGRSAAVRREEGFWMLRVGALGGSALAPLPPPALVPTVLHPAPRPMVVTRDALGPGRTGIGRRALLEVLGLLPGDTPWLVLVLEGVLLLEDPQALEVLRDLEGRGVPVRLGRGSALMLEGDRFDVLEDVVWQRALAGGHAMVL